MLPSRPIIFVIGIGIMHVACGNAPSTARGSSEAAASEETRRLQVETDALVVGQGYMNRLLNRCGANVYWATASTRSKFWYEGKGFGPQSEPIITVQGEYIPPRPLTQADILNRVDPQPIVWNGLVEATFAVGRLRECLNCVGSRQWKDGYNIQINYQFSSGRWRFENEEDPEYWQSKRFVRVECSEASQIEAVAASLRTKPVTAAFLGTPVDSTRAELVGTWRGTMNDDTVTVEFPQSAGGYFGRVIDTDGTIPFTVGQTISGRIVLSGGAPRRNDGRNQACSVSINAALDPAAGTLDGSWVPTCDGLELAFKVRKIASSAPYQQSEIVSSEISISQTRAQIRLELSGGRQMTVATQVAEPAASLDSSPDNTTLRVIRGDAVDRAWRVLLNEAMDVTQEDLRRVLLNWRSPNEAGKPLEEAIHSLLAESAN